MAKTYSITTVHSPFGDLRVLWTETPSGPRVSRIFLPTEAVPSATWDRAAAAARVRSCAEIDELCRRIRTFLGGQVVAFDIGILDLPRCPEFQRQVLAAEAGVPRGWITTYGSIAAHLGNARAGRAVGGALGSNPFPIVIPCHRAISADMSLGGFRGGVALKRSLLALEGIRCSPDGKVLTDRIHHF